MENSFIEVYQRHFRHQPTEPSEEKDVHDILKILCRRNGYLDPLEDAQLRDSPDSRDQELRLSFLRNREVLAKYTTLASNQLYDDRFRFFFEMLQNADDAKNEAAPKLGSHPCVEFTIHQDKFVVDLIENQFKLENVVAICSTGASSKGQNEEIGYKGLGFKSVFGIATTVHIQSKPWSFILRHERGEDGIQMISPTWCKPSKLPQTVTTRITLTLAKSGENATTQTQLCDWIENQPVSIIGFLKRIGKVKIVFKHADGSSKEILFEYPRLNTPGVQKLITTVDGNPETYVFREFSNFIPVEPTVENNGAITGIITLRFPVFDLKDCEPVVNPTGQYTFAYLPMRQVPQLPFIIHANFIVTASRQDPPDNLWNQMLKRETAKLFADAVQAFVTEEPTTLRFRWLSFLPARLQPIAGFWNDLLDLIKTELLDRRVFISYSGKLSKANQLRSLPNTFLHLGKPILQDLGDSDYSYLSLEYQKADAIILRDLGIRQMPAKHILNKIRRDCESTSSELQLKPLTDPWHDSYVKLLKWLIQNEKGRGQNEITSSLQLCAIIPVKRGDVEGWQHLEEPIYLPVLVDDVYELEGQSIAIEVMMPTDLDLTVLHPEAAASSVRKEIYGILGVQTCPPGEVRRAVLKAQKRKKRGTSLENYVAHFELLFCYGFRNSENAELYAKSANLVIKRSNRLFFNSADPHEIANLVALSQNRRYDEYFLNNMYTDSKVEFLIRDSKRWNEWLEEVAGVRSYPTLNDPDHSMRLHPLIVAVRDNNPASFLPMIQKYWSQSYSVTCGSSEIRTAVLESSVLCRDENLAELQRTWFPSTSIVAEAQRFDVEMELPILSLPDSRSGCDISEWPALQNLKISADTNIVFYKAVLVALASRPEVQLNMMCELYREIGRASLHQKGELQDKDMFLDNELIWEPTFKMWLSSNQCVLRCEVPLECTFVITPTYPEDDIRNLFETLLDLGDATVEHFIYELEYLQKGEFEDTEEDETEDSQENEPEDAQEEKPKVDILERVTEIYTILRNMANDVQIMQTIRSNFRSKTLIYHQGIWLYPGNCIWHVTAKIGNYISIGASYPGLRNFFIDTLHVKTVTAAFMLQELAKAATAPNDAIRELMLEAGKLISDNYTGRDCQESIEILKNARFLPCKSAQGAPLFLPLNETYFIIDDHKYTDLFAGKLCLVDFSYRELTTLHKLFELLGLKERYLSGHVKVETVEGETTPNDSLTQRLQDCAYALSCCAVFYHSPLYSHDSHDMHDLLRATCVHTSSNMRTEYTVKQGRHRIRVPADKVFLTIRVEQDHLRIVLPEDEAERSLCLRSQLPRELANKLQISNAGAEKLIYRLINEVELGTDQILADEDIPHTDTWLSKSERLPLSSESDSIEGEQGNEDNNRSTGSKDLEEIQLKQSSNHAVTDRQRRRSSFDEIPEEVNHLVEAPEYGKLLDHLRRRAAAVVWRNSPQDSTLSWTDDTAALLKDITIRRANSSNPSSYPELFGNDGLVKCRLGAAGEFFALELLGTLTRGRVGEEQWRSRIRHFARAHKSYSDISNWRGRETADIVYDDSTSSDGSDELEDDMLKMRFQRQIIGDSFEGWLPQWMSGECTCCTSTDENSIDSLCKACNGVDDKPLLWLFEIKTTLGPCETPFFIGSNQYELMRTAGTFNGDGKREVYCIIRIYNLLQSEIGVRIFIDPWRFRDDKLRFSPTDKLRVRVT